MSRLRTLAPVLAASALSFLCAPQTRAVSPLAIETVTVGNAGNPGHPQPFQGTFGAVSYVYAIAKQEVTAGQYATFLDAVAATDTYGLYDTRMWTHAEGCKIERTGAPGSFSYDVALDWENRPVNFVSWGSAARFANWLHNGQPAGAQDLTTTEDGSYFLNGKGSDFELESVVREPDATWVIPTENEWYKAAYHANDGVTGNYFLTALGHSSNFSNDLIDPDPGNNATFSNSFSDRTIGAPYYRTEVGAHENSQSPYGTFDQGGNVQEFNETVPETDIRGIRGGSWFTGLGSLLADSRPVDMHSSDEYSDLGFRVATLVIGGVFVPPADATASLRFAIAGPHPIRDEVRFRVVLPEAGRVRIDVFDLAGRRVPEGIDETLPAGASEARWKVDGLAPGVYLARLSAVGRSEMVRFVRTR